MASWLFLREMEMQRKLMPKGSVERRWSTLVDLVCGYGEKPFRIIPFAIVLIAFCAGLYSLFGAFGTDIDLGFMGEVALVENAYDFVDCLIYSAAIFVSLGYTELAYAGVSRSIASIEAFVGGLTMAFFLVLMVRKFFR